MLTKVLKVDDKWSIKYDKSNNDRPVGVLRYGEDVGVDPFDPCSFMSNFNLAMFYKLLEQEVSTDD